MKKYVIFGGTTEGRILAKKLLEAENQVHLCVATDYGEEVLFDHENLTVQKGRLDEPEMSALFAREEWYKVIDATHPYAALVSQKVKNACESTHKEYVRILRKQNQKRKDSMVAYVASLEEAINLLNKREGNILLTTGSKELPAYLKGIEDPSRIYARILPEGAMVDRCKELGLSGKQIICMQGPFQAELNAAMIKQYGIDTLVTKDTGDAGGFLAKIEGAKQAGAKVIVIQRPVQEEGYSMEEFLESIGINNDSVPEKIRGKIAIPDGSDGKELQRKITILGIGMGSLQDMTLEAQKACQEANLILGAPRMLETLSCFSKESVPLYKGEEILSYIEAHPEKKRIVAAFSGDVGFYSGTRKLLALLKEKGMEAEVLPGISSVVYLASKLHTSWEDVKLVSVHGRKQNLLAAVKAHEKVFSLAGYAESVRSICRELMEHQLGQVKISVGCNLSYPEERILTGRPEEFLDFSLEGLSVLWIENEKAEEYVVTHGIPDESFQRGKAPMTKEEVRSISLSKLALTRNAVVYDVGAGTGSIGLECARIATEGMVYAIEKKEEALELLGENKKKLGISNLEIVAGLAPEALEPLPTPTHAFIGGSSGNMKEIVELLLQKNPNIRIVINCIALETVAEVMNLLKEKKFEHQDIVHAAIGKSKTLGSYHMMMGQNPVYIITLQGECR